MRAGMELKWNHNRTAMELKFANGNGTTIGLGQEWNVIGL